MLSLVWHLGNHRYVCVQDQWMPFVGSAIALQELLLTLG